MRSKKGCFLVADPISGAHAAMEPDSGALAAGEPDSGGLHVLTAEEQCGLWKCVFVYFNIGYEVSPPEGDRVGRAVVLWD